MKWKEIILISINAQNMLVGLEITSYVALGPVPPPPKK